MNEPERNTVTVAANELTDVNVSHISLVRNAANRSPFKILKSGGTMNIDLKKLFTTVRKQAKEPAVALASVMVLKDAEAAAEAQAAVLGLTVVSKSESNEAGIVTLNFVENAEDVTVLKMDDTAAVGIVGVQKMFYEWAEGESFIANMATAGFYPSMRLAGNILNDTIYNIMEDTPEGTSPSTAVSAALADFSTYVKSLVASVPVTAYKFEGLAVTVSKQESTSDDGTEGAEASSVPTDSTSGTEEAGSSPTVTTDNGVEPDDAAVIPNADTGTQEDGETESVTKSDSAADIASMLSTFRTDITASITKSVEAIQADVTKSADTIKDLSDKVTKMESDIRGTVSTTTKKDEETTPSTPKVAVFDSALDFTGLNS